MFSLWNGIKIGILSTFLRYACHSHRKESFPVVNLSDNQVVRTQLLFHVKKKIIYSRCSTSHSVRLRDEHIQPHLQHISVHYSSGLVKGSYGTGIYCNVADQQNSALSSSFLQFAADLPACSFQAVTRIGQLTGRNYWSRIRIAHTSSCHPE